LRDIRHMHAGVTAGLGFLFAVLWLDLMFDLQAARSNSGDLSRDALVSISSYYRRITTTARPMNRLVTAVMAATLAALIAEIWTRRAPAWAAWTSLCLTAAGIGLAAVRTFRNAVRIGRDTGEPHTRSDLARSLLRDHIACALAIATALFVQLAMIR
jgi:hypothetical protein